MTTEQQFETVDMMLNMGPQHPATHGVFRMVLTLDGERVEDVRPHIGYLHRGSERLCETESYGQVITLFDRLDYISNINNELAFVRSAERLMEIEVPERAMYIRRLSFTMMSVSGSKIETIFSSEGTVSPSSTRRRVWSST